MQTDKEEVETTTPSEEEKTYSVGDEFCLDTECFYVISDNGDSVTALAKYNLLVGKNVTVNLDGYQVTSISDIDSSTPGYGIQSESAKGFDMTNPNGVGAIIFETNDNNIGYWVDDNRNLKPQYGTSYPVFVFDSNSNLYQPLKNYENHLKNTLGKSSATATLLTYEQAVSLGCVYDNYCSSDNAWVHSTSYWTGSASTNNTVYAIQAYQSLGFFGAANSDDVDFSNAANAAGLRPVITISKSEI